MYEWQDWALGTGIAIFLALTVLAWNFGGIVFAGLAAVCAYFYGARRPRRKGREFSASYDTVAPEP